MSEHRQQRGKNRERISQTNEMGERGQAELELSLLASIVESSDDAIIGKTLDGIITSWNKAAERLYGYTAEEALGKPISIIIPPDHADQLPWVLERIKRGERIEHYETARVRKDGGRIDVSVTVSPIKARDGKIVGASTIARDITERKRAENERERLLKEAGAQRELFQAVIENAPVGIALLRGPDFVFELVNPTYQAIAPGKVMLGRPVSEVWPELADQVLPLLRHVLHTGESFTATDMALPVLRVPEGPVEEVYFTFAYVPMRAGEGQPDAILVLVIETTEQVLARRRIEELAEMAQRRAAELQSVLENMVDGVYACDTEGRITMANENGIRMLGFSNLEEVTRALTDFPKLLRLRHPDGRPFIAEELPLVRALAGKTIVQDDEVARNPRTQRDMYLRVSSAPIRGEKGKIVGAVAVARDITDLTELERLKDEFISVAAHELKTPVAIMKGYAQALMRAPKPSYPATVSERATEEVPPPNLRMLDAINRGADRIDRIVKDLLDISQIHLGRLEMTKESVDLPDLVEEVTVRMAQTTIKHRIRVVEAEPVVVQGDRDRLEQVLTNLIDNAIKYSPKGGDIEVAVAVWDHEAVISVRDHGVGIPEAKQEHIFERFYRAHAGTPYDYAGMGVGLYISKQIISQHGGHMWFESEEGKGSTFYFSLPLA